MTSEGRGARLHAAQRLDDELRVLTSLSFAYPLVFLSVAAFMVNAVLARIVRLQREQIAQMKALGYSSRQVGSHYLKFVLVIGVLGTLIGALIIAFGFNGLNIFGAPTFSQYMLQGAILIVAVGLSSLGRSIAES